MLQPVLKFLLVILRFHFFHASGTKAVVKMAAHKVSFGLC
jgi:cell division protein FtsB